MIDINFTLGIAIYGLIWFMILFMVLPFGVQTQSEANDITPGTVESAPSKSHILKKFVTTGVIAAIVYGFVHWALVSKFLTALLPELDG